MLWATFQEQMTFFKKLLFMPSREQFSNLNILSLQVVWIELTQAQGGENRCFMREEVLCLA